MTKGAIKAHLETYAQISYTGSQLFNRDEICVRNRNVRVAVSLALEKVAALAKIRGEKVGVYSVQFFDEVRAEAKYRHEGTDVLLKGSTRLRPSRMTYYVGSEVRVLTRRQVAKLTPALAKRMRELGYPYGIYFGRFCNIVCCKKYRVYKGYVGAVESSVIDYPPYSIWSVL